MKQLVTKNRLVCLWIGSLGLLSPLVLSVAGKDASVPAKNQANDHPYGIAQRVPWTKSRVTGTPEPPPPYKSARLYPKLQFKNPLLTALVPGTDRVVVG